MSTGRSTLAMQKQAWIGMRVSAHPATDSFMMGDVYGNVVGVSKKLGSTYVSVKMDRSGKTRRFLSDLVLVVR